MSVEIAEGTAPQASPRGEPHVLRRRLGPLYLATFLQNLALWVPIEKLFMTTIGFTSASIGLMASVYAVVVPVLEVPSGVIADRWSRRGVLILGSLAATVSVVIGGFSQSVGAYLISAAFLGVFFALQSGTLESIVYDTLLEETGDSGAFERTIGRVRLVESIALVTSALAGGVIAEIAPLRTTYFLTAPLLLASIVLLFWFREPQLHKAEERESFRRQIATTYRTILGRGPLRAVVALTVVGALLMQGMLEFGPLWLVALVVPAFLYGPHWAGLTSALGVGGVLGGQSWLTRRSVVPLIAAATVACSVVLAVSRLAGLVIAAQVTITLLVVAVSIPVTRRLHDAVPSAIRAGVASGVGTVTWLAFVPFALVFGVLSERAGVDRAGWLFVGVAVIAALLMMLVLREAPSPIAETPAVAVPVPASEQTFAPDRFFPPDDSTWPGHWAKPPVEWGGVDVQGAEALERARTAIAGMPAELRRVLVLRDVEGRSSSEAREVLGLTSEEERAMLHQARGIVRADLERYFDRSGRDDER